MEWPPRSGKRQTFPEVDRAEWFTLAAAHEKINTGQRPLLERLAEVAGSTQADALLRLDVRGRDDFGELPGLLRDLGGVVGRAQHADDALRAPAAPATAGSLAAATISRCSVSSVGAGVAFGMKKPTQNEMSKPG